MGWGAEHHGRGNPQEKQGAIVGDRQEEEGHTSIEISFLIYVETPRGWGASGAGYKWQGHFLGLPETVCLLCGLQVAEHLLCGLQVAEHLLCGLRAAGS